MFAYLLPAGPGPGVGWGAGASHLDPWTPEQRILAPFQLIYKPLMLICIAMTDKPAYNGSQTEPLTPFLADLVHVAVSVYASCLG